MAGNSVEYIDARLFEHFLAPRELVKILSEAKEVVSAVPYSLPHTNAGADVKDRRNGYGSAYHLVVARHQGVKIGNSVSCRHSMQRQKQSTGPRTNHDRLEIDRRYTCFYKTSILFVYLGCENRKKAPGVRLPRHVERPTLELDEVLEEDGDEGGDIPRSLLRRAHSFAVFSVRESDADGLVDEEYVRVRVP